MHDFCFTIPYGFAVLAGGVLGYARRGSTASLVGGAGAGALLLLAGFVSLKAFEKRRNSYLALALETRTPPPRPPFFRCPRCKCSMVGSSPSCLLGIVLWMEVKYRSHFLNLRSGGSLHNFAPKKGYACILGVIPCRDVQFSGEME